MTVMIDLIRQLRKMLVISLYLEEVIFNNIVTTNV